MLRSWVIFLLGRNDEPLLRSGDVLVRVFAPFGELGEVGSIKTMEMMLISTEAFAVREPAFDGT